MNTDHIAEIDKKLESYINGNITFVKSWLASSDVTVGEFLELYIESFKPDTEDIVLFVKRLSN